MSTMARPVESGVKEGLQVEMEKMKIKREKEEEEDGKEEGT